MAGSLVELDFVEHDTIAALKYLIDLFEKGEASGMIFSVKLKHKRKQHRLTGATGSLASNLNEGAGFAGVLHFQIVQQALEAG